MIDRQQAYKDHNRAVYGKLLNAQQTLDLASLQAQLTRNRAMHDAVMRWSPDNAEATRIAYERICETQAAINKLLSE